MPFSLIHLLRHLRSARSTSTVPSIPRKRRFGWYPTNLRMAFLNLQFIAEPKIGHTIEKHFVEQDEQDDEGSGDPKDPTSHILRQAKKLQRGIPLERLTARLPPLP
jgi:hypothetical protein